MLEQIENLKLISIVGGVSVHRGIYTDRFSHAFVCKTSGVSEYDFGGRTLVLRAGEVLFLPKGVSFGVKQLSHGESQYVLINFDGVLAGGVPRVYSMDGLADAGLIHTELVKLWIFGGAAERYRCLGVFYHLLSAVVRQEQARYADTKHVRLIRPAVEYLREHIFDPRLKVGQLHQLCGLSDTYFRRLFRAEFGINPQEYVTNKRLTQVAAVISGGDYAEIGQVARSAGYKDALYFSRAFTRRYGVSPTGYIRKLRQNE